ncbi:MAG: DUF1289 domain-containing protein [Xanthobacteraceae bacterium]
MASATSISSPCNRICVVHPTARMCIGCGRSLDEIARWIALSEIERSAIMAQLPARLAALSGAKDGIASVRA